MEPRAQWMTKCPCFNLHAPAVNKGYNINDQTLASAGYFTREDVLVGVLWYHDRTDNVNGGGFYLPVTMFINPN